MKEGAARCLALIPLAPLALGSCLGVLGAGWGWNFQWGVLGVLGALLFLLKRKWMLAAGIGCGVLLWGVHQERLRNAD